jgi:hypothetical protein
MSIHSIAGRELLAAKVVHARLFICGLGFHGWHGLTRHQLELLHRLAVNGYVTARDERGTMTVTAMLDTGEQSWPRPILKAAAVLWTGLGLDGYGQNRWGEISIDTQDSMCIAAHGAVTAMLGIPVIR